MSKKEISRRLFLKGTAAAGVSVAAASMLAGCGPTPAPSTTVAPTEPASTAAPTVAPTVAPTTAPTTAPTEPAPTQPVEPEFVWETGVTDAQSVTGDPNRTWTLWDPNDPDKNLIREGRGDIGENGAVSSPDAWSAWAGVQVMQNGGNAVDAAAAVAFAISVCDPQHSGIGGGGFMTARFANGDIKFINFREYAPELARDGYWWPVYKNEETGRWMVVGNANMTGGRAIGVPGTVAGMKYAVENYGSGKLSWKELIQPAVDLAEKGFWMGPTTSGCLGDNYENLLNYPEFGSVFLLDDETTEKLEREQNRYYTGDKFTNPQQAMTLKILQEQGADDFYKGTIAEASIKAANKYGGTFLASDFANYEAKEKDPVRGSFMGKQIISTPLPSSGGTSICEILNIMEAYGTDKLKEYGHNSAKYIHVLSEAMKMAYADRAKYLYDYGEETEKEREVMDALTSKEYAKFLASLIKDDEVLVPESHDPFEYEHQDTVSYSVADKEGNIVTVTFTVNGIFGSKVVPNGYGFILNNEMGDFSSDPTSVNAIAPFKYPLSSMSPTIVLNEDGTPFMTVGSPGGATIIAAVTNCILNVVLFGMEAQEAVNAPRAWDNANNKINYENRIPAEVIDELVKLGHEVNDSGEWPAGAGSNQVVVYAEDGKLHAAADPRRDCKAWAF